MTLSTTDSIGPAIARHREPANTGAARWLSLAAAPTFAIMALLTGIHGDSTMLCASTHNASPLTGMVAMYLLMCAFHLPPWLRLVGKWRGRSG